MNQWIILTFLIAFIMGYKYCSTELRNPFLLVFAVFILYTVYAKSKELTQENFENSVGGAAVDDTRVLRYGDVITVWSVNVGKFLQADPTQGNKMLKIPMGKVTLSNSLLTSEDIPSSMNWVQFMILDASDPGDVGNTAEILHGAKVYLRSVQYTTGEGKPLPTYLCTSGQDNGLYLSPNRYPENSDRNELQFIIESGKGLQYSKIRYGDVVLIKSTRTDMPYIHVSNNANTDVFLSTSNTTSTNNFYVCDRFGQGLNIEWARRGSASQSSTDNNYDAQLAIDGNLSTFSSTTKEDKAWWEVTLPKDVMVDKIITNNINDTSRTQLNNFTVKILDRDRVIIDTKNFSNGKNARPDKEYLWNNINQIGRIIRIELNSRDNLNIATVRVYGQGVNYSILLNEEMSKNVFQSKQLTSNKSITIKDRTLPLVKKDMTIMMLLEFDKLPEKISNIFIKSRVIKEGRTPNLLILPPKQNSNYSLLQYVINTEGGNNETGDNFLINYNVLPNKKFHFTAVHNAGINQLNSWFPCTFSSTNDTIDRGTYVCNFTTRELYKIPLLSDSTEFGSAKVSELGDPSIYGFELKGLYTDDLSIPTIKIYINGILNTTYTLKSDVIQNSNPLTIGSFSSIGSVTNANILPGFDGEISYLKYSNRAIPEEYIQRESQLLTGKLSIQLIKDITRVGTTQLVKMQPNLLPDINKNKPEYTIHFWMNSQRPLAGTGNDESIITYGEEGLYFYSDKNTFFTKTNLGNVGIEDSKYNVPVDQWIHVAYVVKNTNISLYVNGTQTASGTVSDKDVKKNSFSIISLGGFNGLLGNVYFANYALSVDELKTYIISSPINSIFDKVRAEFNKNGCIADPIDITNPYIDTYNSAWISFATKDETPKLSQSISDFKKLADEGIETEDIIKLKLSEKCYGKDDASLRVQLNRNKKQLKAAENNKDSLKCLPKAPYTCKSINEFDIRTHKDFPLYIEKAKVRQAPKPVERVTNLPPDPTKYIDRDLVEQNYIEKSKVEESKAYLDMKKKLDDLLKQLEETKGLKDLVSKCKKNEDKLTGITTTIANLKDISVSNPQDPNIQKQIDKLSDKAGKTEKLAGKDADELLKQLSIKDMIDAKTKLDKDLQDIDKLNPNLKDNVELSLLGKNMNDNAPFKSVKNTIDDTIAGLNKTDRLMPNLKSSSSDTCGDMSTIRKYGWLQSKIVDLDNIDSKVKNDLSEIKSKLSKFNTKINNSNMSESEAAVLKNKIASIQQNQLSSI